MTTPQRRPSIDPSTADLLGRLDQAADQRRLPLAQRRKAAKESKRQSKRNRVMLDLPPEIEQKLIALAAEHDCSISNIAGLLLWYAMQAVDRNIITISDHYKPSRTGKHLHALQIPDM